MELEYRNGLLFVFGVIDLKGKINGLLGLDLLLKTNAVIDLKNNSLFVS